MAVTAIRDVGSDISKAAHHQNRGPEMLAVLGILAIIATILVFLRLLARKLSKTPFWIDDYLILMALAICITCAGIAVRAVHFGTGQHIHNIHHHSFVEALKIIWASQFLYVWCLACVKLSIIFQLWRIFSVMDGFRVSAYILSTLVVLWAIACTVVTLLQCRPIDSFWFVPASNHCLSGEKYYFASGIPNIVTELSLILVPLPFVLRLGFVRWWQRLGVATTFVLGGFTIIVSIYRLTIVYRHKSSPDTTWSFIAIITWSGVEYSVGIMCACIPALAPLVRSILRRIYQDPIISTVRQKAVQHFPSPTLGLQRPRAAVRPAGEEKLEEMWIGDEQVLLCGRPYDKTERGIPMEVVLTKHVVSRN